MTPVPDLSEQSTNDPLDVRPGAVGENQAPVTGHDHCSRPEAGGNCHRGRPLWCRYHFVGCRFFAACQSAWTVTRRHNLVAWRKQEMVCGGAGLARGRGRLARWTLRGALLFGGIAGAWCLSGAVADDPAQAAAPARPCLLGDLLDGAEGILGGSVLCPPSSPGAQRATAGVGSGGRAASETAGAGRSTSGLDVALPTTGGRSARARAPMGGTVDAAAASGVRAAVDAATPVTRPVVGLTSPVVEEIAETGLLESVGVVVRPVAEPIVNVLPSALAPVLGLTQPVLGPIVSPCNHSGPPADVTPVPTDSAPAVASLATITGPAPPTVTVYRAGLSLAEPESRGGGSGEATVLRAVGWPNEPGGSPGAAPGGPGSTCGSGSAAAGAGIPADVSPRCWTPDLQPLSGVRHDRDNPRDRSCEPDTTPA